MIRPTTLIKHSPDRTPGRDRWETSAACLDVDPELFFVPGSGDAWEQPSHADQLAEAKAVCASCPEETRAECLARALYPADERNRDKDSIRGAMTPAEREEKRRADKRKSQAKEKTA